MGLRFMISLEEEEGEEVVVGVEELQLVLCLTD
jgi:hypothetical protein